LLPRKLNRRQEQRLSLLLLRKPQKKLDLKLNARPRRRKSRPRKPQRRKNLLKRLDLPVKSVLLRRRPLKKKELLKRKDKKRLDLRPKLPQPWLKRRLKPMNHSSPVSKS
jgi:hypothetical protein